MTLFRLSVLFVAIVMCFAPASVAQERTPKPGGKLQSRQTAAQARSKAFEEVTKTVSVFCFDEEVCGKKWDKLKLKYKPLVASVKNDDELHILLQRMLNELNTSHFRIVPKAFENKTEVQPWGIGVDLAIIDSQLVVTNVHKGSPADKVNMRPGFAITKIDNTDVSELISRYKNNPLWGGRNWKTTVSTLIHSFYLNGNQNSAVDLGFLDGRDTQHQVQLGRRFMHQAQKTVEHKVLEGGVGYIKLGVFDSTKMPEFCAAVRSMDQAPAVILDLRDNPGGIIKMAEAMAGLLASKPLKLGRTFKKDPLSYDPFAEDILESYPQVKAYDGRLVVLINEASASSSEILAAGLRENGRAVIVGRPSMGEVMASSYFPLSTPALLQLAVSDFETANGIRLEGKGVTPDITVGHNRRALLENTDGQLRAALELIKKGEIFNSLKPTEGKPVVATEVADKDDRSEEVSAPVRDPKAESVLDNYTSAIGGRAAIEKLHSRIVTGTVKNSVTGAKGKFTIYDQLPDKYMMITQYDDGTIEQNAFDGAAVWTFHSQFGFERHEGAEADKQKLRMTLYPALDLASTFKRKYKRIHYFDGSRSSQQAVNLIGAGNGGDLEPFTEMLSFDKKTGLLTKGVFQYSDYRLVDKVRVPFLIEVPGMLSYAVEQVSHNIDIPAGTFEKPVKNCFTEPN